MKLLQKLFSKPTKSDITCSVVFVAAGQASRMDGKDKILLQLDGIPVLIRAMQPFQACPLVQELVVVTTEERMVEVGRLCSQLGISKLTRVIRGGATRTQSVQAGLQGCNAKADLIGIHDGARPFVTEEIIRKTIEAAQIRSAAAPGIPVKDTIKRAVEGVVQETLPREELFAIQTPQIFEASLIRGAIAKALEDGANLTDDCGAVERIGFPVFLTEGSEENIKLTTPYDLVLGEAILEKREEA